MATWNEVALKVKAAADAIQFEPSRDINKVLRYGMIDSGAGNEGKAFTAWFFALGDIRHIRDYLAYAIHFARYNESFTLEQLKGIVRWVDQAATFCDYCGFHELQALVQSVFGCLDQVTTKEELVELIKPLRLYASHMNMWSYHYFPYAIGYLMPLQDAAYFKEGLRLAKT
jgi:hypothetical protein